MGNIKRNYLWICQAFHFILQMQINYKLNVASVVFVFVFFFFRRLIIFPEIENKFQKQKIVFDLISFWTSQKSGYITTYLHCCVTSWNQPAEPEHWTTGLCYPEWEWFYLSFLTGLLWSLGLAFLQNPVARMKMRMPPSLA